MPFQEEGIDALYIHSTYENPYEHSRQDLGKNIDFDHLKKVTAGIVSVAIKLSSEGR